MAAPSPKILFIDDDPGIQGIMGETLVSAGYEVAFASNGEEGLTKFDRECFQAVITDLWMPVMDGISTVVALRVKDKNIPIILISGLENKDEFIAVGAEVGANQVLRKPVPDALLLDTLSDLLN